MFNNCSEKLNHRYPTQYCHEGGLRYISHYLIQYVLVKAKKAFTAYKRAPGARVLTSNECAQILAEREEKKGYNRKKRYRERLKEREREKKTEKRSSCKREGWKKKKEASRQKAEKKANIDSQVQLAKLINTRSKTARRCNSQDVGPMSSTDDF